MSQPNLSKDDTPDELDDILNTFGFARGCDPMLGQSRLVEAHAKAKARLIEWGKRQQEEQVMQDFLTALMVLDVDESDLIEWRDACSAALQRDSQPGGEA